MGIQGHPAHREIVTQPDTSDHQPSWVASVASETWSAVSGAARVAGQFGLGAARQVYEHPGRTALQVAGGVATAAVAAEAGVGVVAGTAIAAVPAAGYGLYRGASIAINEGVGAIPGHVAETYRDARAALSNAGSAIATLYSGRGDSTTMEDARRQVQDMGSGAVPLAAGLIGGAGGQLGSAAMRAGANGARAIAESTLPTLELQPAYVTGAERMLAAGARSATTGDVAVAGATTASATATVNRMEAGSSSGAAPRGEQLEPASRHNLFVEGRVARAGADTAAETSLGRSFTDIFQNAERIMARGGREGHVQLSRGRDGMLTAEIVDGERAGATALWDPKNPYFSMETSPHSVTVDVPIK